MSKKEHSYRSSLSLKEYSKLTGFDSDWRDSWWNDEFLAMMGKKWHLDQIHTVLDVGCGVGHWGQRLMGHLNQTAFLEGIDAEQAWIEEAHKRATSLGLASRTNYQQANVASLPWPDHTFDMVTCQTLLIHVPDLQQAIQEMTRVLRPEGLFVAAEPNNFAITAAQLIKDPSPPWSEISDMLELHYICTQGKLAVGEGHQSAGELLPSYLKKCGWTEINIHQNNQCAQIVPPYTDLVSATLIQFMRNCYDSGAAMVLGGTQENALRFYLAGGGDQKRFSILWKQARTRLATILAAVDAGTYISGGGHIHYLVWGHKPISD